MGLGLLATTFHSLHTPEAKGEGLGVVTEVTCRGWEVYLCTCISGEYIYMY